MYGAVIYFLDAHTTPGMFCEFCLTDELVSVRGRSRAKVVLMQSRVNLMDDADGNLLVLKFEFW